MEHIVEVVINWIVILMAVVGGASMVVQGLALNLPADKARGG